MLTKKRYLFVQFVRWLQYAEENDEKVHIIGHHPPWNCLLSFRSMFSRIVQRYSQTIAGQFFAHTHNDEFSVFYDEQNSTRPVRFFVSFRLDSFRLDFCQLRFAVIHNLSKFESELSNFHNRRSSKSIRFQRFSFVCLRFFFSVGRLRCRFGSSNDSVEFDFDKSLQSNEVFHRIFGSIGL